MAKRRLVEGLWDCKYCNSKRIRGSITECPNCARARDEDTIFYLDHQKITYVPKEESARINRNADWLCKYCDQLNSDSNLSCSYCGASRTSENLDYHEIRRREAQEQAEKMAKEQEENESSSEVDYGNTSIVSSNYKNFSFEKIIPYFSSILITFLTVFGIIALISLFLPKEKVLNIE